MEKNLKTGLSRLLAANPQELTEEVISGIYEEFIKSATTFTDSETGYTTVYRTLNQIRAEIDFPNYPSSYGSGKKCVRT